MKLKGRVAVVTGASRGIGAAIAVELAALGANVVINYKSDRQGAENVLQNLRQSGGIGTVVQADVSRYGEAKNLIEEAMRIYGKVDILVNNAGISRTGLFIDMDESDWDQVMDVNLKGVYNCTSHVLKYMLPRKSGSIINVSSMWGAVGASCEVIYSAAKGGVDSFTRALAKELAPSSIRVNAVAPGVIETGMNSFLNHDEREALKWEIPLGYFGTCTQVAKTVAFLCSEDSDYITGQVINVNGGII